MNLGLSGEVRHNIEEFAGCSVQCASEVSGQHNPAGQNHVLSFSGGFDSLAAKALLPSNTQLVSHDFGGPLQREADFFKNFSPSIVRTNFRRAGFASRSWLFMLAGVVLLRDHLNIASFSTGAVLESSAWNFRSFLDSAAGTPNMLSALGLSQMNVTQGLTEIGTTLLCAHNFPEDVSDSLSSLAAPGSAKAHRKSLILDSLIERNLLPRTGRAAVVQGKSAPLRWGSSFADDMLAPYLIKNCGVRAVGQLMRDIPDSILELSQSLELTFYERFHTGLYQGIPAQLSVSIQHAFTKASISPYTERDWMELRLVQKALSAWHSFD